MKFSIYVLITCKFSWSLLYLFVLVNYYNRLSFTFIVASSFITYVLSLFAILNFSELDITVGFRNNRSNLHTVYIYTPTPIMHVNVLQCFCIFFLLSHSLSRLYNVVQRERKGIFGIIIWLQWFRGTCLMYEPNWAINLCYFLTPFIG